MGPGVDAFHDSLRTGWDAQLLALDEEASVLQSAGHGAVQAEEGWNVERASLRSGGRALVLVAGPPGLRRGYVPYGPVPGTVGAIEELVGWARGHGLVRLRVQPAAPSPPLPALLELGFRIGPTVTPGTGRRHARYLYPEHTRLVELGDPRTMLLACRPKHRYNIRLAERRGVVVAMEDDASELHRQQTATAARQGIRPPALDTYRRRLRELPGCHVYVARVDGEAVAAIMTARFGARAYYLFGGSTGAHRERMPAYALQWQAMLDAAAAGCRHYDLFGVPATAEPTHPWHGLWRFKTGFGGTLSTTPGALDYPLRPLRSRFAFDRPSLPRAASRPSEGAGHVV